MKTNHIHTSSRAEAWAAADSVFPCDYMHDGSRSSRAGYDVYFSTNPEVYAWISDLGNRLEVNLQDGSTVNVWIDEPEEEETEARQMIEATRTAARMTVNALHTPEVCQRVTIAIDGEYGSADEKKVYEAIRKNHPSILLDILTRYAETHGIKWGGIWGCTADHYNHGDRAVGHYIVSGYISGSIGAEMEFLASCAAVMAEEVRERRQ